MFFFSQYQVTLVLAAAGFTPSSDKSNQEPSFSREVEIATVFAPGPIPRSKVPEALLDKHSTDYDVTIGLLTGANQRFVHHHVLS